MAYKPVGLLSGVVAGAISTAIVRQVWKRMSNEDDPPTALQREYRWLEIVVAALVQGAVFGVVRALVQRGGAKGVQAVTGTWPGD
jgi:hypothetical protein